MLPPPLSLRRTSQIRQTTAPSYEPFLVYYESKSEDRPENTCTSATSSMFSRFDGFFYVLLQADRPRGPDL